MTWHETIRKALIVVVVALGLLLVFYLFFLWLVLLPFRLAYRLHAPAREREGWPELTALAALATAVVALLRSRRDNDYPAGWHPCENPQCRGPIPKTSRAKYCSEACRRYARVRMQAADWGEHPFDTTLVTGPGELPESY
jgi:hypothetical protein